MKRFVRRKWGWYFVILKGKHFKVKLLRFKERCNCSLQYHNDRKELWLFLYGGGQFDDGDKLHPVAKGNWVEVGFGQRHKFLAFMCTYVLEVQYGSRCVEGDIVRL